MDRLARALDDRPAARRMITSLRPRMPRPFAAPGTRTHFVGDRPAASSTSAWTGISISRGKRLSGTATLTLVARRDRLTALTFDAVELDVESVTVDGRARRLRQRRREAARRLPEPPAEGAKLEVAIRYACQPRRGLYFIGPDADHPERAAAVLDAGTGRRLALLLAVHRSPDREVHDRGDLRGARGQLRAVERRPARAAASCPATACAGTTRSSSRSPPTWSRWRPARSSRSPTARRAPASTSSTSCRPGARPTRAAASARTPEMIDLFSERIGVPYPYPRYSQITVRRVHLRRHGEHHRDDADRPGPARRARRARSRRRGAGLARAGAPVVRRPAHLPRLVGGLAQRGLRDLLRVRLARARQGARRGGPRAAGRRRRLPGRGRAATGARSSAGSTTSRSTCSTRTSTRRAAACCTCCATSSATPPSGARSRTTRASTRTARSRRAISRAPSRRRRGRNVDELLDRWIARPGHPELEGRWDWDEDRKIGTLRIAQKQPITPGGAAVQVLGAGPLRDRRPRAATSASACRGGDARVRVPPARAPDAGDLRSRATSS